MELMNCRNCKKLFNYIAGEKLCPACKERLEEKFQEVKKYIEEMIEKRKVYKKEKNFEEADKIRKELMDKGIMIKDTREGTTYEIVK